MRDAISPFCAAAALPAIVLLFLPVCALAADPSGTLQPTADVRVGVAGAFKVGRWTPLDVPLGGSRSPGLRLEVDAPDPDGSAVTYHSEPLNPKESGPDSIGLLFKMGRLDGTLRVRVLDGERIVTNKALRVSADPDADVQAPFRQSVFLVANVQAIPAASGKPDIKQIGRLLTSGSENAAGSGLRTPTQVIDVESFATLPTRGDGYNSFDAVLLSERFDLDAARSRALEQWVRDGGHLVISIGRAGGEFAKNSPELAEWLPVKIQGTVKLRDLSPIESFCRQSSRIMGAGSELDAAKLSAPGGQELVASLAGPLLCRAAYGLGRVTVFGLDLNAPALANWSAAGDLTQRLFGIEENQSQRMQTISNRLSQTGITEIGTQLDGSLDEFTPVSRFTVWQVMGLLAALVLLVGPLDFLLVHKLLRRPELTWITFPLMALVAAGSALLWSSEAKGKQVLVNQLDVLDVDAASGWARAHSYGLVYSPENRRYNVSAEAEKINPNKPGSSEPTAPRIAWHGRPEATFGGMYRTGGVEISRPGYASSAGCHELEEVPIAVWSTKNLEGEWSAQNPQLVDSQLESRGLGHLGGTLRHHFPGPIEDWIVAFGHQVFRPRSDSPAPLLPEVPWVPQSASQRELSGYLTGATQTTVESKFGLLEELRTEHADYDPLDQNALGILHMVTFHGEAGGTLYTGLGNGALRQFDWTPLLDLNRAVLIGRIRRPLTHWKVDGQTVEPDQSHTFVRIVLPVKRVRQQEEG